MEEAKEFNKRCALLAQDLIAELNLDYCEIEQHFYHGTTSCVRFKVHPERVEEVRLNIRKMFKVGDVLWDVSAVSFTPSAQLRCHMQ